MAEWSQRKDSFLKETEPIWSFFFSGREKTSDTSRYGMGVKLEHCAYKSWRAIVL